MRMQTIEYCIGTIGIWEPTILCDSESTTPAWTVQMCGLSYTGDGIPRIDGRFVELGYLTIAALLHEKDMGCMR